MTVIVKLPAGVPLAGGCVAEWLHAGMNKSSARTMPSMPIAILRRRPLRRPKPKNANPGIASQIAYNCRRNRLAAGVTIGRGVVVRLSNDVTPLVLTSLAGLFEKLHAAPAGKLEHESVMSD